MAIKKTDKKDPEKKLELTNKITAQRQKIGRTYDRFEMGFLKIFRYVSSLMDKLIFNTRYAKLVALVLACLLYVTTNFANSDSTTTNLSMSQQIDNIPISVNYNSENYEVEIDYSSVKAIISGSASDILSVINAKNYSVAADLTGLGEGVHTVTLTKNFSNRVTSYIEPSRVSVTIKRKSTQQFTISYDFINTDEMSDIYILSEPAFSTTTVSIRTTKEKLESIAMVKALIDVTDVTADFSQDAVIVAYDKTGNKVDCEIIPSTISADVVVTSPSKDIPVAFTLNGTMPSGLAVSDIAADHEVVTVYGTEAVLANVEKAGCVIDTSTLQLDSNRQVCQLDIPAGVKSPSVTKINMDITVVDAEEVQIEGVKLRYVNNYNGYAANIADPTITVTAIGSKENIAKISASDIYVYMDMADASIGENVQLPIYVNQNNYLVQFVLPSDTITVDILSGTSQEDTDTDEVVVTEE